MASAMGFWDRIADSYAAKAVPDEAAYAHKLAVTARYLRPEHEVLEIGCGTGTTALHHAHRVGHLRAVDGSSKMIEIARAKADKAGVENVDFEVSTIEALDVPAQSVDVVMAHSILHLLDDLRGTLKRLHDMLRPGGVLVSSTACLGDKMWWFGLIGPIGHALGLLPLVRVFTRKQFEQAVIEAGFELEVQWVANEGKSHSVFIVARRPE
ncbi:MAG: class I SAM-dependent methyltransferase [Pseudomonadota bacterium]